MNVDNSNTYYLHTDHHIKILSKYKELFFKKMLFKNFKKMMSKNRLPVLQALRENEYHLMRSE